MKYLTIKALYASTLLLGALGSNVFAQDQGLLDGPQVTDLVSQEQVSQPIDNCTLQDCKTDSGYVIRVLGKGEIELRDTDETEQAHSKNRRVDIKAQLNQVNTQAVESPNDPASADVSGQFVVYLDNGGVLWATEDPVALNPQLGFSGPTRVKFENGQLLEPINLRYFSNYSRFIKKLEIVFYKQNDVDLISPILRADLPSVPVNTFEIAEQFPQIENLRQGDTVQYVLRAYGNNGAFDETSVKRMQLLSEAEFNSQSSGVDRQLTNEVQERVANQELDALALEQEQVGQILGRSDLVLQNIALRGSRVRIVGQDIPYGSQLEINGQSYPVDIERKFAAEYLLPIGQHSFDINLTQGGSVVSQEQLNVNVTGKYLFMVAMADITASDSNITGSLEPLAANDLYQDDFLIDGRLAFYLKGKVKGKYLITAQADTQERELNSLFTNFLDKDPQDVFRRLDPDQYYLVYGDDSRTYRDVDTQGRLYLRVDWDKSQALWGNYNTGIAVSEVNQYNRSLYGAAFNWRSLQTTENGEAKTRVRSFLSEAQTAFGHNEFIGTGGSLYYLRDSDILPGSDKLSIEIRDRDSSRVLEQIDLVRDVDYEIDEFQGRIILARPLEQLSTTNLNSIIRDEAFDGNRHFLLADYEYRPDGFDADEVTIGGRAKHWIGEHLALGATYIDENRAGDDYQLKGADITLQAGKGTYLRVEQMNSNAAQAPVFYSDNGGLNFGNGVFREGDAQSIEARANFKELGLTQANITAGAWSRDTDAGFSVARRDLGVDTKETGAEFTAEFSERWRLYAKTSETKELNRRRFEQNSVQLSYILPSSSFTAEVRAVSEQNANNPEVDGTLAALQYRKRFGEKLELFGTGQVTAANNDGNYDNNDRVSFGARYLFADRSEFGAEYGVGHRGESGNVNWDYRLNNKHNLYGRYTFSTDSTVNNFSQYDDGLTLGHRSRITDKISIYNENQNLKGFESQGFNHTFGLDYRLNTYWNLGLSLQHGELDGDTGFIDRDVISTNMAYRNKRTNFSSVLEYRTDEGTEDIQQWVSTNRWTYLINDDWRLAARFNYADTENDNDINPLNSNPENADAKFIESGLGFAYRSTADDRWSILGRYTYLYDLRPLSQRETTTDQKSDVFSLEAINRLNARWELVAKAAHRRSEIRLNRQDGLWFDSTANFAAGQVRYHLVSKWDALAEYRWLSVNGDNDRSGFLLGIDRRLGTNFKFGVGYNFTEFSDDLTQLEFEYKGWFLNLVGLY